MAFSLLFIGIMIIFHPLLVFAEKEIYINLWHRTLELQHLPEVKRIKKAWIDALFQIQKEEQERDAKLKQKDTD